MNGLKEAIWNQILNMLNVHIQSSQKDYQYLDAIANEFPENVH